MGERPPAGWYHDASGRERWYDGDAWSDIYRSAGVPESSAAVTAPVSTLAETGSGWEPVAAEPVVALAPASPTRPAPTPSQAGAVSAPLRAYHFRPAPVLEGWLVALLLVDLLLWILALVFDAEAVRLTNAFMGGSLRDGRAQLLASDERQMVLAIIIVLTEVLIAILFLVWLHRMSRNARALGAQGMRHSPGGAVGWWFVPVAAYFMPFQVMREIWRASARPLDWRSAEQPAPAVLGWYWAAWISSGIAGLIGYRVAMAAPTLDGRLTGMGFIITLDVLSIAVTSLALAIVWRLPLVQVEQAAARGISLSGASGTPQ